MATVYETLRADIITAVKARDSVTALALRTADGAIQKASLDAGKPIDDAMTITALRKAVKNLQEAATEAQKANRPEAVAQAQAEAKLLEKYLPQGLDPAKLDALIVAAIAATGATTRKDMGKVIGLLKQGPDAGAIDFGAVSKLVQAKLA